MLAKALLALGNVTTKAILSEAKDLEIAEILRFAQNDTYFLETIPVSDTLASTAGTGPRGKEVGRARREEQPNTTVNRPAQVPGLNDFLCFRVLDRFRWLGYNQPR